MFPSSFGLTCCVAADAEALQITARWGHYRREHSQHLTKEDGSPRLIWKRTPKGSTSKPIPLQAGRFNWKPDPALPEVYVQGLIRKRDDHWSVTLFLVNGQEEPKKLRDQAWLFQPELTVECPQGKPIFFRRPGRRDLSHYETFEHYHATFYKHVEALSVTPFAPGSISRGLTALLVSCVRHQGTEFNANDRAQRLDRQHPAVQAAIDLIVRRSHLVGNGKEVEQQVQAELLERLDQWLAEAQKTAGGRVLAYDEKKDGLTVPLLRRPSLDAWDDFTCLNSLREVEPTAGLILDDGGLDDDPTFATAVSEDAEEEEGEA